ncbi:MAG: hypothetical protein Q8R91_04575 [Candidatus Omnitrophota bacterium]|nr:hypothetical protein [Candidatus Omnitrophota bacterium]
MRHLLLSLSLLLGLSSFGCYTPVRWPRRTLWAPSVEARSPIQSPQAAAGSAVSRIEQDGVSVLLDVLDRRRAQELFHADLLGRGVQPISLAIRNGSGQTYRFSKADVALPLMPSAQAAQRSLPHPAVRVARLIKWGFFFFPGLVMQSIVEPTTTLDFPVFEETAKRPPRVDRQAITADFRQQEIADGAIGPDGTQTGFVFARPLRMGQAISLRLINAATQQPLMLRVPMPPPVYAQQRDYAHPYEKAWGAVVSTASAIKAWRVASADRDQGILVVRKGVWAWRWSTLTEMTISVERLGERRTRVTLRSPLRGSTSLAYGARAPSIERFFEELELLLPPPPRALPKKPQAQTTPSQEKPALPSPVPESAVPSSVP